MVAYTQFSNMDGGIGVKFKFKIENKICPKAGYVVGSKNSKYIFTVQIIKSWLLLVAK